MQESVTRVAFASVLDCAQLKSSSAAQLSAFYMSKTDTSSRLAAKQGFGVPNRIGSLNFCPTCGNLLDVPKDDDVITCAQCGHTEDAVRECRMPGGASVWRQADHLLRSSCSPTTTSKLHTIVHLSFSEYENISITTRSHPDAFPSVLKDRRSVVKSLADNKDLQDDMTKKQEIEEKCPDCGQ